MAQHRFALLDQLRYDTATPRDIGTEIEIP